VVSLTIDYRLQAVILSGFTYPLAYQCLSTLSVSYLSKDCIKHFAWYQPKCFSDRTTLWRSNEGTLQPKPLRSLNDLSIAAKNQQFSQSGWSKTSISKGRKHKVNESQRKIEVRIVAAKAFPWQQVDL
jgi:hypothetical protein